MKGLQVCLAALGGLAVGAAVALLYAPQKGRKTRRDIVKFVKEHCPMVKESEVESIADAIEEKIEEKVEAAKKKVK